MLDLKKLLAKILDSIKAMQSKLSVYISEQGTDGIWNYRKWSDGTYEAWGSYAATGLNLTTASANTYYGTSKTIDLPSFSKSCTVAVGAEQQSQASSVYIYQIQRSNKLLTVQYRAHTSSTNAVCNGQYYVRGTW